MPGFGFGLSVRWRRRAGSGGASIPDGALTDDDGALLTDDDGAILLEGA